MAKKIGWGELREIGAKKNKKVWGGNTKRGAGTCPRTTVKGIGQKSGALTWHFKRPPHKKNKFPSD